MGSEMCIRDSTVITFNLQGEQAMAEPPHFVAHASPVNLSFGEPAVEELNNPVIEGIAVAMPARFDFETRGDNGLYNVPDE